MKPLPLAAGALAAMFSFFIAGAQVAPRQAAPPAPYGQALPGVVVPGAVVSLPFGCTAFDWEPLNSDCPEGHFHSGLDLAASSGAAVLAPYAGEVLHTGPAGGCGIHVTVRHSPRLETLYCHLAATAVRPGDRVQAGAQLGWVGSTGNSSGPHLHLEVHWNGRAVDPSPWLAQLPALEPMGGTFR